MPSVLVVALHHLNIFIDKYSFPGEPLYNWNLFRWQMNHYKLKQNPRNYFYFATLARVIFIVSSLFCYYILLPNKFINHIEALLPVSISCMMVISLMSDILMINEGTSWLPVTNWLQLKDCYFPLKLTARNYKFYRSLILLVLKGNQMSLNN